MVTSEAHDPLAGTMINLLLQRLDGRRKLVVACPVPCFIVLHIYDTTVDGLDNIPCTFGHHIGDMCVALQGHDIASHGLEEILGRLSGATFVIPNLGETK